MPTIEESLDAVTHNLELVSQMQLRTEQIVNLLAEDQAKTERNVTKMERTMSLLIEDRVKTESILARPRRASAGT
jgi:hypothetical protein